MSRYDAVKVSRAYNRFGSTGPSERSGRLRERREWLSDPRFESEQDRGDHGEELSERTARWCAERTTAEALADLEAARVPAGPVYTPQQALDDEHVNEAGLR